eukprot:1612293-Rhodomonas_salina.4
MVCVVGSSVLVSLCGGGGEAGAAEKGEAKVSESEERGPVCAVELRDARWKLAGSVGAWEEAERLRTDRAAQNRQTEWRARG